MPELTDAHRAAARRAITLAGFPPAADPAERSRRSELVDALAAAIADAASGRPAPDAGAYALVALDLGRCRELVEEVNEAAEKDRRGLQWQKRCEVLAGAFADLDRRLQAGGPLPTTWGGVPPREDPEEARHAAAADRLSWDGSEGLIITPPPADPS